MDAPAKPNARGVEVRLLRRLPAQPARLRGRAARARRADRDRLLPRGSSATVEGPYDVSLVEGLDHHGRTTPSGSARSAPARAALITIGACATAGGIQALRNFADVEDFTRVVYASPDYISTLATSTPISAHVPVDFELHGCPINKRQLLEVISAHLNRRRPRVRAHSVCVECKRRGTVCVMVAHGTPASGRSRTPAAARSARPTTAAATAATGRRRPRTPRRSMPGPGSRSATWSACTAPSTPALSRSSRRARAMSKASRTRTIRTDYLARVEGEGGDVRQARGPTRSATSSCASTSRRGSSRRSCAAARSPRRPTSPRGSAASARSPTR